jgi:hypothetical protein
MTIVRVSEAMAERAFSGVGIIVRQRTEFRVVSMSYRRTVEALATDSVDGGHLQLPLLLPFEGLAACHVKDVIRDIEGSLLQGSETVRH